MTVAYQPPKPPLRMSLPDYFEYAFHAEEKQEFRDGEVVAMSGGTVRHSLIISNLNRLLGQQLRGSSCRVYDSNLRVSSPLSRTYSYPDATVICGEPMFDPKDPRGESVSNPILIAEVLSPTTAGYDRGKKFIRNLAIESLREYLIVEQAEPQMDCHCRGADGTWALRYAIGLDSSVSLPSLGIELALKDVYEGVRFAE